jgi:hypothetical protein
MTQSHSPEKAADRCAGELLWNVSLLPVAPGPRPWSAPEPLAQVVELPLPEPTERERRRSAA